MVPEAIINICLCLLLLLFMLIATVTLLFLIKKEYEYCLYAFSDFYQHVKSGQTVPKCIDIKYFYI